KSGVSDSAPSAAASELRELREAVVREHMESENHHDFDTTIGTFAHPRYEIIPTGDVYDGEQEARRYFAETRTAFPDQRNELISLRHAEDAVVVALELLGPHLGPLRSLPPTGRAFRTRVCAYVTGEGERSRHERGDGDQRSSRRQRGSAHDPS